VKTFGVTLPDMLKVALRVAGVYAVALMLPGAIAGSVGQAWLGGVPDGWFFCFPDRTPALLSGVALTILLPVMRPPRLRPINYAVYGMATPILITTAWLASQGAEFFPFFTYRVWLSSQIPAMLVATAFAVATSLHRPTRSSELQAL
jgi:hypothetical protein